MSCSVRIAPSGATIDELCSAAQKSSQSVSQSVMTSFPVARADQVPGIVVLIAPSGATVNELCGQNHAQREQLN